MARRVLVTRPQPAARDTARRLVKLGFEVVVLPLSETMPLLLGDFVDAADFDVVVVTSANALRHAPEATVVSLSSVQCVAVGDRTAEEARRAGFDNVASAVGNVSDLTNLIDARFPGAARIAYLCGRERRPEFEAVMTARGKKIVAMETYDLQAVMPSLADWRQSAGTEAIDDVLVYSGKAAEALNALAVRPVPGQQLTKAYYFCLSSRIATTLDMPMARVRIAERPDQDSLFAALKDGV